MTIDEKAHAVIASALRRYDEQADRAWSLAYAVLGDLHGAGFQLFENPPEPATPDPTLANKD